MNPASADSASPHLIPAATVVLVRDRAGELEVLLLQRNSKLDFAGGAWVFPGGAIDAADAGADALEQARVAACREAAEEANWRLEPSQLHWFAHWTGPETVRKRFATWFFIADVSGQPQEVVVDGSEIVASHWVAPAQAVRLHETHQIELMPPTLVTLNELAAHAAAASALAMYRQREVRHFQPRVNFVGDTVVMLYAGDAGYDTAQPQCEGPRHRCELSPTGWKYIRTID